MVPHTSDETLLHCCRCGNLHAAEQLVRRLHRPLYEVLWHLYADEGAAQAMATEALVRLLCGGAAEEAAGGPAVTTRLFRGALRHLGAAPPGAEAGGTPLRRALWRLSVEERQVFLLREVAGLQFREIAVIVECPEPIVKSRLRLALESLHAALSSDLQETRGERAGALA